MNRLAQVALLSMATFASSAHAMDYQKLADALDYLDLQARTDITLASNNGYTGTLIYAQANKDAVDYIRCNMGWMQPSDYLTVFDAMKFNFDGMRKEQVAFTGDPVGLNLIIRNMRTALNLYHQAVTDSLVDPIACDPALEFHC